jgi:hypothetical protein
VQIQAVAPAFAKLVRNITRTHIYSHQRFAGCAFMEQSLPLLSACYRIGGRLFSPAVSNRELMKFNGLILIFFAARRPVARAPE